MSTRLAFTGDVMLGRNVDHRHRHQHRDGPPEAVWGSALSLLRSLDGLVVNLECCLSTRGRKWTETRRPFHFRADPGWAVPALRAAGVDVAALANNHLLDYRAVALRDTVDHLDDAGIAHAGAGADGAAAREPAVVNVDGVRVGLCAFTDNTPEYAAGPDSPGVARLDMDLADRERAVVRDVLDTLQAADVDLVVASLHWGPNMVAEPAERYRRFGRWLLEAGVDLIHGHSAHVFQGVERRPEGLILYDCGDFVDDYAVDGELRNDRSFLFEVTVGPSGDLERLDLHPVEIRDLAVETVGVADADWWVETLRERSQPFGTATAFERSDQALTLAL